MFSMLRLYSLRLCIFVASALLFVACGGANSLKNDDPFNLGAKPSKLSKPATQAKLVVGEIFVPEEKNKNFDLSSDSRASLSLDKFLQNPAPQNINQDIPKDSMPYLAPNATSPIQSTPPNALTSPPSAPLSDFFALMSPSGAVLTVWALAQGNWLWGYDLINSASFGDARIWRFRLLQNDEVLIENAKTLTCVNIYRGGLVHMACDESNANQRFKLIPMSNEAVMLKSVGANTCIQAELPTFFSTAEMTVNIYNADCEDSTYDEQWYIIAPPFGSKPLYKRTK